jgi:hypothetical protein
MWNTEPARGKSNIENEEPKNKKTKSQKTKKRRAKKQKNEEPKNKKTKSQKTKKRRAKKQKNDPSRRDISYKRHNFQKINFQETESMQHESEVTPPPPIAQVISDMDVDWGSGSEFEGEGFGTLTAQLQSEEAASFLLQDDVLHSGERSSSRSKRSTTHNKATEKPSSNDSDVEPPFAMATLNFVVLYAKYEREFLERTKAALGTEYLPYSVREEMATNAFLAARCAMALEAAGTPHTSNAVFTAGMTPDQKEQATEDALTPEDHLRAHLDTRTYFDTLLPDRLALMASLAFS